MKQYPNGGAQSTTMHSRGSLPPLNDLIDGIDLPALVATYAGPGKHSGGSWLHQCPNPEHPDASPSFSVFKGRNGQWLCGCLSQCGHVGNAFKFVQWLHKCDNAEAVRRLREFAGQAAPLPHRVAKKSKSKHVVAAQPKRPDPGFTVVNDAGALSAYLNSRQWPAEVVEAFGLQVVRLNRYEERNTLRVLHPFFEHKAGEWRATSWQGRRLDNVEEKKWLAPFGAALPLYNLRALDPQDIAAAVVCEGPADTVTAWLATRDIQGLAVVGVPGSQAWRAEWAAYFEGLAVVIAGDNDKAGATFTDDVAGDLRPSASLLVAACPPEGVNDLTDMAKVHGLDAVRELLTKALPVRVPSIAPTTAPPGDLWAAISAAFPGSFTVCRACFAPTANAYCDKCTRMTRTGNGKPLRWAECDHCHEFSLAGHGTKCRRCGEGHRVACEVQP
jgi:DNA primase